MSKVKMLAQKGDLIFVKLLKSGVKVEKMGQSKRNHVKE